MTNSVGKLETIIGRKIRVNESLEEHTLLKIPVFAEMYFETDAQDVLIKTINVARSLKIPIYILGSGARIDAHKNLNGLVIKNLCRRFDKASMKGTIRKNEIGVENMQVYAQAGVLMNQLVRFTIEEGLSGLEYQLGLPGTVGGAVFTNAKYKPKYLMVNKALQSVTLLNETGDIQTYNGQVPYFVYTGEEWQESKEVILSVVFKLTPADKKLLWARAEEAIQWRKQHEY
ncbi:MAG TPA: FAD-binding protein [Candidatus Sulfotelmatobacter sp.]|jgi:UDP-N-acetylmuramate dehydrogenase|nr:FAD-binding protein [Candidatus Sulfotelmatobacter sp.]